MTDKQISVVTLGETDNLAISDIFPYWWKDYCLKNHTPHPLRWWWCCDRVMACRWPLKIRVRFECEWYRTAGPSHPVITTAYPSANGRMQDIAASKTQNAIKPSVSKNGSANMTIFLIQFNALACVDIKPIEHLWNVISCIEQRLHYQPRKNKYRNSW